MAAREPAHPQEQPSRRRKLRYRVQTVLDVTVLRSGIPDTLPGRSVNLSECGVGAWLAGELLPGETVAIEIHLPDAANPLRTRALVRHHDKLRYGLEFIGLSQEQQKLIRDWAGGAKPELESGIRPIASIENGGNSETVKLSGSRVRPTVEKGWRRAWILLLLSLAVVVAAGWWRWNRGWEELESDQDRSEQKKVQPQAHVPAEVMQRLVIHRVDPDYPAAARLEKLQGIIVLDVIVDRDGSVADVHTKNGPEILARAATDALHWWRFEPYRLNGQPVAVETTVAVEFKP